jgi:hypothetical protein
MRFDLRLHGRTSDGTLCQANVSVYASSKEALQAEAAKASETAPWHFLDGAQDFVPEGSSIVVERVESLGKPD